MTIIRSPREHRDFTIISNSVCLDPRLSMRALGLLVRLLCRPDNWQTNSETLAREFECGREQIRGVLRELSQAGYMALRKTQSDNGRWSSVWHVFDRPVQGEEQPKQATPEAGKPEPGKPYFGELGPITRTDLTRTDNNPHTPKGASAGSKIKRAALPAESVGLEPQKAKAQGAVGIQTWLDACRAKGEMPVPEDDPVFAYAESVGIPDDMLALAWREFRIRYAEPGAKRYRDWCSVFRKAVRGNWLKLWYVTEDGGYELTSVGKQAQLAMAARRREVQA